MTDINLVEPATPEETSAPNVVDLKSERDKRKLQSQKIVEKHLVNGKKLTQQEALTILTEMCEVVQTIELKLNELHMRLQTNEFQGSSTSAMNIAMLKLLQKKGVFTEEEFKEAWVEFIETPMKKAREGVLTAENKIAEDIKEKAKKDSLDAARGTEESDTSEVVPSAAEAPTQGSVEL